MVRQLLEQVRVKRVTLVLECKGLVFIFCYVAGTKLKCPFCERTYGYETNLRAHIRQRHQGIRVPCPYCHRSFTRNNTVRRHIAREHRHVVNPKMIPAKFGSKQVLPDQPYTEQLNLTSEHLNNLSQANNIQPWPLDCSRPLAVSWVTAPGYPQALIKGAASSVWKSLKSLKLLHEKWFKMITATATEKFVKNQDWLRNKKISLQYVKSSEPLLKLIRLTFIFAYGLIYSGLMPSEEKKCVQFPAPHTVHHCVQYKWQMINNQPCSG